MASITPASNILDFIKKIVQDEHNFIEENIVKFFKLNNVREIHISEKVVDEKVVFSIETDADNFTKSSVIPYPPDRLDYLDTVRICLNNFGYTTGEISPKNLIVKLPPVSHGTITVIYGPMMSGKTTELLRNAVIYTSIKIRVLYLNHSHDIRRDTVHSTHNPLFKTDLSEYIDMMKISDLSTVTDEILQKYDVVCIDEGQFFEGLYAHVLKFSEMYKKNVIVSGLNGDFHRMPFGEMNSLISIADEVIKIHSCCKICAESHPPLKKDGIFTLRIGGDSESVIDIGGSEKYVSVCRDCYVSHQ